MKDHRLLQTLQHRPLPQTQRRRYARQDIPRARKRGRRYVQICVDGSLSAYLGARSPSSEDPLLFEAGDANLYRYVRNSPPRYTDPAGTDEWTLKPEAVKDLGKAEDPGKYGGGKLEAGAVKGKIVVYPAAKVVLPQLGETITLVISYEGTCPERIHFLQFVWGEVFVTRKNGKREMYEYKDPVKTTIGDFKFSYKKNKFIYLDVVTNLRNNPLAGRLIVGKDYKRFADPPGVGRAAAKAVAAKLKDDPDIKETETKVYFNRYVLVDKKPMYRVEWSEYTAFRQGQVLGRERYEVTGGGTDQAQLTQSEIKALDTIFPDQSSVEIPNR